jgi:cyclophilin family peptidyl-prolyl cis-trans isomerase
MSFNLLPSTRTLWLFLVSACLWLLPHHPAAAQGLDSPTNVQVKVSRSVYTDADLYRVSWTDNATAEDYYAIFASTTADMGTEPKAYADPNSTSVEFPLGTVGYPAGTTWYFWVRPAKDGPIYGGSESGFVSLPAVSFNAPTGLSVTNPANTNFATLTFTDNSTQEGFFEVWATDVTAGGSLVQLVNIPFSSSPASIYYYLQPGRTYALQLRAARYTGAYGTSSSLAYTGFTNSATVTMSGTYDATPPQAPTNLSVASVVDSGNYFMGVHFDDTSTDENGFEVQYKAAGAADTSFATADVWSVDNTTSISTNLGIGDYLYTGTTANVSLDFRVRALRGNGPFAIPSAYSSTFGATTASFNAPTNLRVTSTADNGRIQFFWSDNATAETGYVIQHRFGTSGTFTNTLASPLARTAYSRIQDSGGLGIFPPSSTIQFQIAATNGTTLTAYSSIATVTTPPLTAPTNLAHTTPADEQVVLTWTDNSGNEGNYEVQYLSPGATTFSNYDYLAAGTTTVTINGVPPGTQFRVRATYGSGPDFFSDFSNVITASPSLKAPTSLAATAASGQQINLTWTDNSAAEGGYAVYYKPSTAASYSLFRYLEAGTTSASVTGLIANTAYDFQVAAVHAAPSESARSNTASTTTQNGFTSSLLVTATLNQAFSYQAVVSTGSTRSSWSITGLPAGLSFDSGTGIVSGTPTASGDFGCPMTASFANGQSASTSLTIRVLRLPVVTPIAAQSVSPGGNTTVSLSTGFADPEGEYAARIVTNLGTMDFILFSTTTPLTVTNFRNYMNATVNNFNGAVFHRSEQGFVVQGGAFKVASAPNNFTATPTNAAVVNEPGLPNMRGTVAMAKLSGDPNSATNQFFVNLTDNRSILDAQNGGFTVFARVTGNGMAVADAMAELPRVFSTVNLDGVANTGLTSWPVTSGSVMDTTKMVTMTSVAPIPVLSYAITGNSNPAAVTASISGTDLLISGTASGQANITVTATDLDGGSVSQVIAVTVGQTPAITSAAPTASGTVGTAYSFTCTASGLPAPTFAVASGTLPNGLTLSSEGVISGTPTAAGVFTGTITASNTSGTSPAQAFSITVVNSLSAWAAAEGLPSGQDGPEADPDNDGRKNLLEYALMSSPGTSNGSSDPAVSSTTDGADKKTSITFKVRKFATLTYTVEGSSNLTSWTTVWTSTDGFAAATVVSAVDNSDHTLVTIKDSVPYTDATPRFLRLKVTSP